MNVQRKSDAAMKGNVGGKVRRLQKGIGVNEGVNQK